MNVAESRTHPPDELPPDNAARIAIFDAMHAAGVEGRDALSAEELGQRALPRLRILVPRELHNATEPVYLEEKIRVCLDAGLLRRVSADDDRLALADVKPLVRYPNDELREYTPGLELARERLEATNARLRASHFDVRSHVQSTTERPERFALLVESMREHGFLKHFPIVELPNGEILDGRARLAAASEAGVEPERFKWPSSRDREIALRRDSPLNRVLLVLDQNAARLALEERQAVHDAVAAVAGRPWIDIAADLELTRPWRRAPSRGYKPTFAVRLVRFRPESEPRIHVTKVDDKVLVRSLLQAAGLAPYRVEWLKPFVHLERGKSDQPGAGPAAQFAPASALSEGIEAMLQYRREHKMKVDREWDDILAWLGETFTRDTVPQRS